MKFVNTFAAFVLFIIFLMCCAVGPNYQKPEYDLPETYENNFGSNDSLVNLQWWTIFEDTVLHQLINYALANNQSALIAAQRVEEARNILGFTRADIYPQLDIQGNYNYRNQFIPGVGETSDDNLHVFQATLPFSWEIDFWGKFRRANEAARAELVSSEFGYRAVMISLISEVATTYFTLLDYRKRLEIANDTWESRKESVRIIQDRFDEGYVPEIDLNQAQIQEAIALAAIPSFERFVRTTENALNLLLGRYSEPIPANSTLYEQNIPDSVPVGFPAQLITRRPDVLQAEYALVAQNARIGVAQGQRFPAISLTGLIGVSGAGTSFTTGDMIWSVGGSLLGPVFNFGKNLRRVDIERARFQQSFLSYELTVLTAVNEVENALIGIETYQDEFEAANYRVRAARNANTLSQSRYDGGVTSYLEVLESDRSKFDAELFASQTLRAYLVSYVDIYKALGGGWLTEEKAEAVVEAANEE
jgi:multidrug efflux system outer membrane protein